MQAQYPVSHAKYTGSTDADGYPTGDAYATAVDRLAYGVYPLASQLNMTGDYDRRVVTSKVLMVPDVSLYSARDTVVLPGTGAAATRTYFVSEDVRDYSTGPFGFKPSPDAEKFGEIILEVVS